MKLELLCIGKTSKKYIEEGIAEYEKRIKHYIDFEIRYIKDIKDTKNMSPDIFKETEGKLILSKISDSDFLILLDEKGKMYDSVKFSNLIENKMVTGVKKLIFVIGGAYGFSAEVYKRANSLLSLSPMTFSHQPVRILFTEQLYRAFSIIKNEPYHK